MTKVQKILINSKNVVPGTNNNTYNFQFANTRTFKEGSKMCLSKLCVYYSWFNINKNLYNNNIISYKWFNSSGNLNTIVQIEFDDGFYSYDDMTEVIANVMFKMGHYTKGSTSYGFSLEQNPTSASPHFYIRLRENSTFYACELDIFSLPPNGTTGITRGSNSWALPSLATQPQLIIPSTNTFNLLIGLNSGTYGGNQTTETEIKYSSFTPQITPCNSVIILNDLIKNEMGSPTSLFYSFTWNVNFGGMIFENSPTLQYMPILPGSYNSFNIFFRDQDMRPIHLKDNSLILEFLVEEPED